MSKAKEEKELREIRKVEDYVKDLRRDVDKRFGDLRKQMGPVGDRAAKTIAERPLLTLAVVFVLGVAVGVALSRSKD